MSTRTYIARVRADGTSPSHPLDIPCRTITEARALAEQHGGLADWCEIYDGAGRLVALHRRDTAGDGTRWFKAVVA